MSFKDLILDFLNYTFLIVLVVLFILYFTAGDRFTAFSHLMASFSVPVFIVIFYLIKLRIDRAKIRKRKREGTYEVILYLTFWHKLLSDAIVYLTPLAMCVIKFFAAKVLLIEDVIMALFVFVVMISWQKLLFSREKY